MNTDQPINITGLINRKVVRQIARRLCRQDEGHTTVIDVTAALMPTLAAYVQAVLSDSKHFEGPIDEGEAGLVFVLKPKEHE